ncbi:MAG: nickel pincer cofactor biosynthesis protein LarC [Deltaproteobacteria bacterium]|nr:MAG: nickel pincer cofactor biosynthesis protein LarC [Deltaproteobacteria bacterium]
MGFVPFVGAFFFIVVEAMRIAYFDCFSGISGDMILGALIDLGLDQEVLKAHLSMLSLGGYRISVSREPRGPITGTRVKIDFSEEEQPARSSGDIQRLIANSSLPTPIKKTSLAVLLRLAEVEGKLHQSHPEHVHFHEVGAVDSIVDMVGASIGLHYLGIERVVASALPLGRGFIRCQHGLLPLPAPATLALLEGVPVLDSGQERELVTPTGAAIITTVSSEFGGFPQMKLGRVGYGVGHHPESHPPNLLRVALGQTSTLMFRERLLLLETSIDDMNPEFYGHLMERLFRAGALDVHVLPAQMKKNRPGQLLRVLFSQGLREAILQILFSETTSIGARIHEVERCSMPRRTIRVQTSYGRLPVKVATNPEGNFNLAPEHDSCQRAALRYQVPLRQVYEEALRKARDRLHKSNAATRGRRDAERK